MCARVHVLMWECLCVHVEKNYAENNDKPNINKENCWEPAREIPPMTRSCGETWRGKASQVSRGPLPEHLPWNQNLSVYCLLSYTLLTLQGAISDHLSLEKVNVELQLVSCISMECLGSNPSDGSLTCLTVKRLLQLVIVYSPPTGRGMKLKTS